MVVLAQRGRGSAPLLRPGELGGAAQQSKIGEDITETLEAVPRQWKVIQTVRKKFSLPAIARELY